MKTLLSTLLVSLFFISLPALSADKPAWAKHPVIASDSCDSLEYSDVIEFLKKYYYPTLGYSSKQNEAGRQMMETYAIATSLILRSQTCLAEALEIKGLTDKLKKQQKLVSSGTSMSKRELKKQRKLTTDASAKITAAAKKTEQMTPEQRKRFSLGSAAYLAGTYATARLFKTMEDYASETKDGVSALAGSSKKSGFGIPNMDDLKKAAGVFGTANTVRVLFTGLQDHASNLYSTSKFLIEYSKEQKLDLPPDATEQLSSVVDWV